MDNLIIDGFGLAFRSHYAFNTLRTAGGLFSGCVYGFLVGLRSLKKKHPYSHITVAWDRESTRRKALFASYKQNRQPLLFPEQINDLKKIFSNLNISQAEYPGEEADDVIASLTKIYHEGLVIIYSSDKDLFQLVRDGRIVVIRPKSGKIQEKYYDEAAVKAEYNLNVKDLFKFFVLRGDSVDNIPGAPRIASSVLTNLVSKYDTIESLYDHLHEEKLSEYQRRTLLLFEDQAILNKDLIGLRDDLDLEIKKGTPNIDQISFYLNKYEIKSIEPKSFIDLFTDMPAHIKKGPIVQSYSLFEEEEE